MGEEHNTVDSLEGSPKIGPVLEQARKERGLTLDDVEQATKIRKRYLAGLEREDYGVLPDAVYAQGFLKTYANYLGLDGEELSRQLKDRRKPRRERTMNYGPPKRSDFEQPLITPGGLDGTRKRRISGTTVLTVVVAVFALAAVIGTLYYVGRGAQTSDANGQASPQESAEKGAPNSEQDASRAKAPEGASGTKNEGESQAVAGEGGGQEAVNEPAAQEPEAPPDTLQVVINVQQRPSWLSIQSDGILAYEDIAQPGFSQTFEADRQLSITTGDAGAVTVEVNGQNVGVLGGPGEVLTRVFTLKTEI
jgi:cytoskeleton protein RodZ